ncbi:MAG TPA: methyltransferase domain-containing protein [Thermoleophilaceae bacterium]|jgi:SAM-dependent methyltransferase
MTRSEYAFDPAWAKERERLAAMEHTFDEGSIRNLAAIGVAEGWHCLEVGAGSGTIASWLCSRVGPTGRVVATDVDTRFLERIDHPNLEVRLHDVTSDPLEEGRYDLVHARAVLEHLPARDDVVARLVQTVKPGGWLALEDFDLTPVLESAADAWFARPEEGRELVLKVFRAIRDALTSAGADLGYGGRLPDVLARHGLVDIDAELQSRLVRGGTVRADYSRLTIELLRPVLAEHLDDAELEESIRRHHDPDTSWMSLPIVAAWGRRPVLG